MFKSEKKQKEIKWIVDCKTCKTPFRRYNSLQNKCGECLTNEAKIKKDGLDHNNDSGSVPSRILGLGKHREAIKKVSKAQAKELAQLSKIKAQLIDVHGDVCSHCGKYGSVDLSHLIGRANKKFATDLRNVLLACRSCHSSWEDKNIFKVRKFRNYEEVMTRLKSMSEEEYWKKRNIFDRQIEGSR